jgi:hypothetical protein
MIDTNDDAMSVVFTATFYATETAVLLLLYTNLRTSKVMKREFLQTPDRVNRPPRAAHEEITCDTR